VPLGAATIVLPEGGAWLADVLASEKSGFYWGYVGKAFAYMAA